MKIYNTLSEKKEDLAKLIRGEKLKMFVCGPTVYDYAHIGHARTYIFFDLVKNYLKSLKYGVFYLQNITDIDDKIINRASEAKISPKILARRFEKEYLKDMKTLGVTRVDKYARASEHIPEIQKQIQDLIKKGCAYKTNSGIYFEIKKFPDYGKLSRQNLDALRPGWRIELDPQKKDPLDFALWKFQKNEYEPSWPSPIIEGLSAVALAKAGRPGWHIEDTAITQKYLGPQYDLHGGGIDLKFPHHESEIAQQEAASGKKPLVNLWMHTGFLLVNGEKMSKSLKNFITIQNFLKKFSPSIFRLIVFTHQYRSPLDYNEKITQEAKKSLDSIAKFIAKIKMVKDGNYELKIANYEKQFDEAIQDDFNTPKALAIIFSLINEINKNLNKISKKEAKIVGKWISDKLKIFKIGVKIPKIPAKIKRLASKRELLRTNQQFVQSDALRKEIEGLGYTIEDTPSGPLIWPQ